MAFRYPPGIVSALVIALLASVIGCAQPTGEPSAAASPGASGGKADGHQAGDTRHLSELRDRLRRWSEALQAERLSVEGVWWLVEGAKDLARERELEARERILVDGVFADLARWQQLYEAEELSVQDVAALIGGAANLLAMQTSSTGADELDVYGELLLRTLDDLSRNRYLLVEGELSADDFFWLLAGKSRVLEAEVATRGWQDERRGELLGSLVDDLARYEERYRAGELTLTEVDWLVGAWCDRLAIELGARGYEVPEPDADEGETCLFGDEYGDFRESPSLEVRQSTVLTADSDLTEIQRSQIIAAVETSGVSPADVGEAFGWTDEGSVLYDRIRERSSGRSFDVYEYGSGGNGFGAFFLQGTTEVAAWIWDSRIGECQVFAGGEQ